jgi:hypothetical protein
MNAITVRVTIMAILLVAFSDWNLGRKTDAAPQSGYGQPLCISQIPLAWGEYKGGSQQSGLAFQDTAGTLRFITNIPCDGVPQVALELRRIK